MPEVKTVPELKQILGAMVFATGRPLNVREMRTCFQEVAEGSGAETKAFGNLKDADIKSALQELDATLREQRCGFVLAEVSGGYRIQSDHTCGKWLMHLLDHKPTRLSRPGLETLAIIAYRQPMTRAEIENIRGVSVDHVIKLLMEMQLIRLVGRSELPGRPFLYGTTQTFLDHFGLKSLDDLGDVDLLRPRHDGGQYTTKQVPPTSNEQADAECEELDEDDEELDEDDEDDEDDKDES